MPDFTLTLRRCQWALISCVTHRDTGAQHTRWHHDDEAPPVDSNEAAKKKTQKKKRESKILRTTSPSPELDIEGIWEMVPASI